jgi:hypothetical protein
MEVFRVQKAENQFDKIFQVCEGFLLQGRLDKNAETNAIAAMESLNTKQKTKDHKETL